MPVLAARLHVFNICWEWSPKILPPSINSDCFSGFPTPSGKCLCSITHSLKYVNVKDTESIKHMIPREGRLRQRETRAWFPTTVFTARLVECSPSLLQFSIQLPQALQNTKFIQILPTYFTSPLIIQLKPYYQLTVLQ